MNGEVFTVPGAQARILEDFNRYGVLVKTTGVRAVQERSQAIILLVNQPGKHFDREVLLKDRTIVRLKEQLALKFCYKTARGQYRSIHTPRRVT